MNLTEQQISDNWEQLISKISDNIQGDRKDNLLKLYTALQDRMMMAPASGIEHYHNCFIGGYVDHVLRVLDCTKQLYNLWKGMGADVSGYTQEELVFAALNHDLGKVGDLENDYYVPCPSEWHRKNQGKIYDINPVIQNMTVPHRSLWLLQQFGVKYSQNEMIGIMIHDGMYDEGNTSYLKSWDKHRKLKNNLPLVLHHADHMASQIEYERWNNGLKPQPIKSKYTKKPELSNAKTDAQDLFKGLFGEK